MELMNSQDVETVTQVLDSLAGVHHEKVMTGKVRSNAYQSLEELGENPTSTESERKFIALFKQCFKSKQDFDPSKRATEVDPKSLHSVPHHLLFAKNLLDCARARESKIKLMHTLNTFRSI